MVATQTPTPDRVDIAVRDVSGQKLVRARGIDAERTVGDLVREMLPRMDLQREAAGRQLTYAARRQRDGRHLLATERVADALQTDDEIVLQPSIQAG